MITKIYDVQEDGGALETTTTTTVTKRFLTASQVKSLNDPKVAQIAAIQADINTVQPFIDLSQQKATLFKAKPVDNTITSQAEPVI